MVFGQGTAEAVINFLRLRGLRRTQCELHFGRHPLCDIIRYVVPIYSFTFRVVFLLVLCTTHVLPQCFFLGLVSLVFTERHNLFLV